MEDLCRFWGWNRDAESRTRLHAVAGDAAEPNFGLPAETYDQLVAGCSHIIHCAGTVRMNLELEQARRSAVGSAEQILSFARRIAENGNLAKVDFVSTVGVAGKSAGTLPEAWLDQLPAFHNTYEQAKAEAESLVRYAVEVERLPITVHRPSMVIGDSRDGRVIHFQIFYFICEFLSGRKTAGLFPNFGGILLDIIPSDTVAKAIVDASRDVETCGRVFHLCSGPKMAPRLEDVKRVVRQSFVNRRLAVPVAINLPIRWFGRLAAFITRMAPAKHRKALATLPVYLDYLADRQAFGNTEFSKWFAGRGHEFPQWRDYLPRVLDHYLAQRQ